ncbi:unnamed protein product [Lasius platythorax]|uniref:Uncharacterized protein n=1 Tax=Lasius platythorax TaxID=488582 RepID=A0AAV2PBN9_9HYME
MRMIISTKTISFNNITRGLRLFCAVHRCIYRNARKNARCARVRKQ